MSLQVFLNFFFLLFLSNSSGGFTWPERNKANTQEGNELGRTWSSANKFGKWFVQRRSPERSCALRGTVTLRVRGAKLTGRPRRRYCFAHADTIYRVVFASVQQIPCKAQHFWFAVSFDITRLHFILHPFVIGLGAKNIELKNKIHM